MIALDDPLWAQLPDRRQSCDVGARLAALLHRWRKDDAFDLEYDLLLGERPSPGAVAALPHLLAAARGDYGKRATGGSVDLIAAILTSLSSFVVLDEAVRRFPEPIKGARAVAPKPWDTGLPEALATRLAADLEMARPALRDALSAAIAGTSGDVATPRLSGLAAAWGEDVLARALHFGEDGILRCPSCGDCCLWVVFPGTVALYTTWDEGPRSPEMLDLKDRAPNRADGRMVPASASAMSVGARAVWQAADRDETRAAFEVVRHMLGRFPCPRCGTVQPPALL